ncbi:unnamed protein product [Rhodiola kirilowii]
MLNSLADIAYRNRINASETMSWLLADYSKEASKTKQSSSFWVCLPLPPALYFP